MAKIERQKRIYRKRIPYGMQNFEDVIKEDCYFVDKTPFIENIEESNKYFFFIRPRRFGKSLTISMLENYYDINKKVSSIFSLRAEWPSLIPWISLHVQSLQVKEVLVHHASNMSSRLHQVAIAD